jgi:hypothetical protein
MDAWTRKALHELAARQEAALEEAEKLCQCADCTQARAKKQISECDKNLILERLPSKIIRPLPGHVVDLKKVFNEY